MKKNVLLVLCCLMSVSVFAASIKKGNTVYVKSKTAALKDGTGIFAKKVATVAYGDQMKVLAVSGNKAQVQLSSSTSVSGWIPTGSLSTKKIVATSSGGTVSASTKELALAGKGFSEESENAYRAAHINLNFALVDSIESIVVPEPDELSFITEGHLKGAEQ